MRPSGETRDLVRPGISSVVGRLRELVLKPESCRRGGLVSRLASYLQNLDLEFGGREQLGRRGPACILGMHSSTKSRYEKHLWTVQMMSTYILGLFGAVEAGVSVNAAPRLARWFCGVSKSLLGFLDRGCLSLVLFVDSVSSCIGIPSSEEA